MRTLQVFFMLLPFGCFAQVDSSYANSRLQELMLRPGSWIHVSTDTIGQAGNTDIGVLTAYELNTGEKQRAICFTTGSVLGNLRFPAYSAQVDVEDLGQLVKALEKMYQVVNDRGMRSVEKYHYVTPRMTVFSMENRPANPGHWDLQVYRRYKNFDLAVPGSALLVRERDLETFVELLVRYQAWLGNDLYRKDQ